MAYDLLIKNGRVVDGSGEPAFQADVAVQNGKIVGVGKYNGAAAKRTIDAQGRVVAPGFIDHHTHFDPQAVWDPYCGSWVHNGHTTVVVGQCGQVIAPVRPGDGEWYLEFFSDAEQIPLPVLKAGVDVTWESVGDYLNALGKKRGINVGTLVGHSGIRRYVMGEASEQRADIDAALFAARVQIVADRFPGHVDAGLEHRQRDLFRIGEEFEVPLAVARPHRGDDLAALADDDRGMAVMQP